MFHPELVSFMHLLRRTEGKPGSWKGYSDAVKPLVDDISGRFPGLFEVDEVEKQVRLTDEGKVLDKWMTFKPEPKK